MTTERDTAARDAIAAVFREEAGKLAASITRIIGDFDAAEEVVQEPSRRGWPTSAHSA